MIANTKATTEPVVELSIDNLSTQHQTEARVAGLSVSFRPSFFDVNKVPHQIEVTIWPRRANPDGSVEKTRWYTYRLNPTSGLYRLVQQKSD